jgi:hypothetical protein
MCCSSIGREAEVEAAAREWFKPLIGRGRRTESTASGCPTIKFWPKILNPKIFLPSSPTTTLAQQIAIEAHKRRWQLPSHPILKALGESPRTPLCQWHWESGNRAAIEVQRLTSVDACFNSLSDLPDPGLVALNRFFPLPREMAGFPQGRSAGDEDTSPLRLQDPRDLTRPFKLVERGFDMAGWTCGYGLVLGATTGSFGGISSRSNSDAIALG